VLEKRYGFPVLIAGLVSTHWPFVASHFHWIWALVTSAYRTEMKPPDHREQTPLSAVRREIHQAFAEQQRKFGATAGQHFPPVPFSVLYSLESPTF
jgi:hypothetical protein